MVLSSEACLPILCCNHRSVNYVLQRDYALNIFFVAIVIDLLLVTQFLSQRQSFDNLVVRLLGVLFSIEIEDPVLPGKLNNLRILLNLFPVCLVPHVSGRFAGLLRCANPVVADLFVGSHGNWHVLFPTLSEANSNTDYNIQISKYAP